MKSEKGGVAEGGEKNLEDGESVPRRHISKLAHFSSVCSILH